VLFSKKARRHEQSPAPTPTKPAGRAAKSTAGRRKSRRDDDPDSSRKPDTSTASPEASASKEETSGAATRKRSASTTGSESPSSKRLALDDEIAAGPATFGLPPKESFTTYRSLGQLYESEIDSTSESTASGSDSGTSSDESSSDVEGGKTRKKGRCTVELCACYVCSSLTCVWLSFSYVLVLLSPYTGHASSPYKVRDGVYSVCVPTKPVQSLASCHTAQSSNIKRGGKKTKQSSILAYMKRSGPATGEDDDNESSKPGYRQLAELMVDSFVACAGQLRHTGIKWPTAFLLTHTNIGLLVYVLVIVF